jgi:ATP-dependent Lon protease
MDIENDKSLEVKQEDQPQFKIPDVLPLLPVRDVVIFPFMIVPLFVSRERSIAAVDKALAENRIIALSTQKNSQEDDPGPEGLSTIGTAALLVRMLKLPDGRIRVLVQGLSRIKIEEIKETETYLEARIHRIDEPVIDKIPVKIEAMMRNIKEMLEKMSTLGKSIAPEMATVISTIEDPGRISDIIVSNLETKLEDAQKVLEELNYEKRLEIIRDIIKKELEVLEVQYDISKQAKTEIDKVQREYLLRQQLKAIQQELGESNELGEEIEQIRRKITEKKLPEEAVEEMERNIKRLEKMSPESAEAATIRNYLEIVADLPWNTFSKDRLDLKKARKVLNEDHYDLEKIKDRIIEYLAVKKLKSSKMKGPILCFIGPPGTGKTSLGKSIARALGRKFIRISLGGVRDEAEIRGHRKTYVGAMPGRIIQGLRTVGTNNPVFMLDEVDKIGADFRGDPSSALLEVLDPEQNFSFRDNYIGVPYDLSNVMFITTANEVDPIQPAFRDRMEIISLSGYTIEEKLFIAKRYLIPRQMEQQGITAKDVHFSDKAVLAIITGYTREAGLRNLEREIASCCRKVATRKAEGKKARMAVTTRNLSKFLGPIKILPDAQMEKDTIGVATGVAWTPYGGDVLFIETLLMKGTGKLTLTGQLGDVMKESAQAALSYARANAANFGIDPDKFSTNDIHIHIPEGATPKDGPSAGVTLASSLISAFTGKPINRNIAMTGEITLTGHVLPIGGLKEKSLAALRIGIKKIIIPEKNQKDLQDLPDFAQKQIEFIPVKDLKEVIKRVL